MRIPHKTSSAIGGDFIELDDDVQAVILKAIVDGWKIALKYAEVISSAGEVLITERLRDGMRAALSGLLSDPAIVVLPGTESRSGANVIPDGRTDIPMFVLAVFVTMRVHDPHAVIECKRVAGSDSDLCREYVREGIDRYGSGKYSENHANGYMVGYVLSGNETDAAGGINAYLKKKGRTAELLARGPAVGGQPCWVSSHTRPKNGPIALSHLLLEFA